MKIIELVIFVFLYPISFLTPKDNSIWCFGAWFGEQYSDNSKFLFEEMSKSKYSKRCIWISRNKKIVKLLKRDGFEGYYYLSFKGLLVQCRCKVFVMTVNSRDFCLGAITRRNTIVQLWHGSPLKKIGLDTCDKYYSKTKVKIQNIRYWLTDNYTCMVSPAPVFDDIFSSALNIVPGNIIRNGYPRCDGLFIKKNEIEQIKKSLGVFGKKFGLFLPTHRGEGGDNNVIEAMVDGLKLHSKEIGDANIEILIKPHFYDMKSLPLNDKGNVRVVADLCQNDLYKVLAASDFLITDYSSVFFDYEILGKPIFFYSQDLDEYLLKNRDMYFDYKELIGKYYNTSRELVDGIFSLSSHSSEHLNGRLNLVANIDKKGFYSEKLARKLIKTFG